MRTWTRWLTTAVVLTAGVPALQAQTVTFRGLQHSPIGSASLLQIGPDTLEVFTSGTTADGFSVNLMSVESATGTFSGLSPSSVPTGSVWRAETFSGAASQSEFNAVASGGKWDFDAGFFVSTVVDVDVYFGDTLLTAASGVSGTLGAHGADAWTITYLEDGDGTLETTLSFASPTTITLLGQPSVTGDRIVISTTFGGGRGPLSSVSVTAQGPGVFFVNDATIGLFGNQHRALGQATLQASGTCPACTLTLGNIGSSGVDGVRTLLEDADGLEVINGVLPSGPTGASRTIIARGVVSEVPDTRIGEISVVDSGSSMVISSDLSGLGVTSRTVELYDDGVRVARVTGVTGPQVGTVLSRAWPISYKVSARRVPGLDPAFEFGFDTDYGFTLPGLGPTNGDRIVVIGENPVAGGAFTIGSVDDQQGDLPGLDIGQEDHDPFCQGDFNNTNSVDLSDLGILLTNFGLFDAGVEDGDTTGEGDVDLEDLANVLAIFGSNCD